MAKYEIKDGVGIIPEGTTKIEAYAFEDCTELTSIVIPDSVTEIGFYAFDGCTGLMSVVIPNSVSEIGRNIFSGCTGLTSIVMSEGNKVYDSRDNCNAIIETESNTLIAGCKNTVVPDSVTEIDGSAFSGCTGLTSIVIPDSVTKIEAYAFSGCTGLTSITIPASVTEIGDDVFYGCEGLKSVKIEGKLKKIPSYAFYDCTLLESITLPVGINNIDKTAFEGCTALKTIIVPAKKSDYYISRLPKELQELIVETGQNSVSAKKAPTKKSDNKVYNITFKCECYLGRCARFADNATPLDAFDFNMELYQMQGELLKETKEILLTYGLYDMTVVDDATGQIVPVDDDKDVNMVQESWVEKKLALETGNRYYIQALYNPSGGRAGFGTFEKKLTFKVKTDGNFDIDKLQTICDTKFDDLYWKVKHNEIPGELVGDIESDEGLVNPYEIIYDGKRVKANKLSVQSRLKAEAYMCFEWPADENAK